MTRTSTISVLLIKNPQNGIRAQMVLKLTHKLQMVEIETGRQPHWRPEVKGLVWIMMLLFVYKQKYLNKLFPIM